MIVQLALALYVHGSCSTEDDCSLAGTCTAGACVCRVPFTGPTCATLALGASPVPGAGGYVNATAWSWGGTPIEDEHGVFHLFASQMSNGCGLLHYQTNSAVQHLTAQYALGPYFFRDTALARRPGSWDAGTVHGPTIRYDASRKLYALFYSMSGSTQSPAAHAANASFCSAVHALFSHCCTILLAHSEHQFQPAQPRVLQQQELHTHHGLLVAPYRGGVVAFAGRALGARGRTHLLALLDTWRLGRR